jgi:hypothetical protein
MNIRIFNKSKSSIEVDYIRPKGHHCGWVEYDAIDYPNNASGWWVKVSRMTPNGVKVRSMHTDTEVVVTEIRTRSGKTVDFFDKEVRRKDALGLIIISTHNFN